MFIVIYITVLYPYAVPLRLDSSDTIKFKSSLILKTNLSFSFFFSLKPPLYSDS